MRRLRLVDELLTVKEIAQLLKLNPQAVRNWIDQGRLPAIRVGKRRVRVRQSDLDTHLAARRPALVAGNTQTSLQSRGPSSAR